MTFDEVLAEWVRRNCRNSDPILGSVEFEFRHSAWGDELEAAIVVDWREMYRPKRGKVAGQWRYGDPVERPISSELDGDVDVTKLLRDIYEISTEATSSMRSHYRDRHIAVMKIRGRASEYDCIMCGCRAQQWAQRHTEDGTRPEHYDPMCITCHRHYDSHNMSDSCPYCKIIVAQSATDTV